MTESIASTLCEECPLRRLGLTGSLASEAERLVEFEIEEAQARLAGTYHRLVNGMFLLPADGPFLTGEQKAVAIECVAKKLGGTCLNSHESTPEAQE